MCTWPPQIPSTHRMPSSCKRHHCERIAAYQQAAHLSLVCEHGPRNYVADSVDAVNGRLEAIVNRNAARLVRLEADVLQAKALAVRLATDADEQHVALHLKSLAM